MSSVQARQAHPYHLVDVSPWPILMSLSVYAFAIALVSWLTHFPVNSIHTVLASILLIAVLWWRDVLREAKGGYHTVIVQRGILIGFLLFLLSEIMLFFSFIWAYLHSSLSPAIELGSVWPPVGIEAINPWNLPLVGTTLLLASGFVLTLSHHALIRGRKNLTLITLFLTIVLGAGFVYLQYTEYVFSSYTIADSVYGTCFYMLTGLHGLHVIAGVTFLTVCFFRLYVDSFTTEHHLGFLFAIWYWHLVDVVWLIVYLLAYVWGGSSTLF